jgi:hypothetical protein
MPNPDAAPQTPGKFTIDLTPGREKIDIDGTRIEQHCTGLRVTYDARTRKPVLLLELSPSSINLTGQSVEMRGEFREFLIAHGWRPPS